MPALPPVTQVFEVNASAFMAGVDEMLAGVERLAVAIDEVAVAADRLGGAADVAAAADERLAEAESAANERADALVGSMDALAASMDRNVAATDANSVALDEQAVSAERAGTASEGAGEKTSAFGSAGKTAFLGVAAAAIYSVDKAASYQTQMTRLLTQAGVAKSQFSALSSGVLQVAGQVGFSPTSLAQALYHVESSFASVGITSKQALDIMKTGAEGARVGGSDLVETQNALDAAVVSGIKGTQNYSQAMGALNAIVGQGDMTMQDLVESMGTGIMASAKLYGQSLTEVGAALDVFGDNNIRGAKAATDLRMTWQAILAPMKTGDAALQHIGLTSTSLATTLTHHGLTAALTEFVGHLKASHVPISDWGQYITEIFGKKAGAGIGVLTENLSRLQGKFKPLQDGAHGFGQAWSDTQKTVQQQWAQFRSGLDSLAISFGSILLPAVTKVLGMLNGFFRVLQANPVLRIVAGAIIAIAVALGVVSAAMTVFNMELLASPITWIVVAVIALAIGLYELYKHFKIVRDIVAAVGEVFKAVFTAAMHAAGAVVTWFVNGPLKFITQQIAVFTAWWKSHSAEIREVTQAVWKIISAVITTAWNIVFAVIKTGLAILQAIWGVAWAIIRTTVVAVWNFIAATIRTVMSIILGVIAVALDIMTGHWSQAWHDLITLASNALHGVLSIIQSVTSGFGNLLWNAGVALIQGLIGGIESMFSSLGSVASSIGHFISSLKGPIEADEVLLVPHGQAIMRGLMTGMGSQMPALRNQVGQVTAALMPGGALTAGGAAARGGAGTSIGDIHLTVNGFVGNQQELMQALYYQFQKIVLQQDRRNVTNGLSLAHP